MDAYIVALVVGCYSIFCLIVCLALLMQSSRFSETEKKRRKGSDNE